MSHVFRAKQRGKACRLISRSPPAREAENARLLAESAELIARRYKVSPELARRIIEMAGSIDRAYAIAELMR